MATTTEDKDYYEELFSRQIPGLKVATYAATCFSSRCNQPDRPLDDSFSVELRYHKKLEGSVEEELKSMRFAMERGTDMLPAVGNCLDTLKVDFRAHFDVIDVVDDSIELLLEEVTNLGRKSLALIVEIYVDRQGFVYDDDVEVGGVHDDVMDDDEVEEVVFEDEQGFEAEGDLEVGEEGMYDDFMEAEAEEEEVEVLDEEEMRELMPTDEDMEMAMISYAKERLLRNGVSLVSSDYVVGDDNSGCCAICLDEFEKRGERGELVEVAVLPCSHVLHTDCLVPWILEEKRSCPLCRYELRS